MKHHEYQVYYGGFKKKLKNKFYCKDCNAILIQVNNKLYFLDQKSKSTHAS